MLISLKLTKSQATTAIPTTIVPTIPTQKLISFGAKDIEKNIAYIICERSFGIIDRNETDGHFYKIVKNISPSYHQLYVTFKIGSLNKFNSLFKFSDDDLTIINGKYKCTLNNSHEYTYEYIEHNCDTYLDVLNQRISSYAYPTLSDSRNVVLSDKRNLTRVEGGILIIFNRF